jgi:hypothetical protein
MNNIRIQNITFRGNPEYKNDDTQPSTPGLGKWLNDSWRGDLQDEGAALETRVGDLVAFMGESDSADTTRRVANVEVLNCKFINPSVRAIYLGGARDVEIHGCTFEYFKDLLITTDKDSLGAHCAILANEYGSPSGNSYRISVHDNYFDGRVGASSELTTNNWLGASDGIFWGVFGGGYHIADNTIKNYIREGIQFNSGPASVVRNNFNTWGATPSTVAIYAYHVAETNMLTDGVAGPPTVSGLTSTNSLYSSFSFLDNAVYGGNCGVYAGSIQQPTNSVVTNTTYMARWGASSDYVVSGNTFDLRNILSPVAAAIAPARNFMFAGNQVINAARGVYPTANYNDVDATWSPASHIANITLMCNDLSRVTQFAVFTQGNFPLVDSLMVYANKMGDTNGVGSQMIQLDALYGTSNTSHGGVPKAKVAIVGNHYEGNPIVLEAAFEGGEFRSILLDDLSGNPLNPPIVLTGPAVHSDDSMLFEDLLTWSLY